MNLDWHRQYQESGTIGDIRAIPEQVPEGQKRQTHARDAARMCHHLLPIFLVNSTSQDSQR